MTWEEALDRLIEGNRAYAAGCLRHHHQDPAWRTGLLREQHPWAVILGCSDSRVPPEIVFDQGLGDLFVIRTAGHVVDAAVWASIEYAVEHLNVPLVVVLGHRGCGAVATAVQGPAHQGRLNYLATAIQPACDRTRTEHGDPCNNATRAHVETTVDLLGTAGAGLRAGRPQVVGAIFDLETGLVAFLPPPAVKAEDGPTQQRRL